MDREKLQSLHDLSGRVAIVTGGTRGIGRSIAEGLIAAGATVVVASRKADACAETEAALRAMEGEAMGVPTHMGDVTAVAALVDTTVERFGRLDIVVNNAANALSLPVGELTEAAWDKSLDVNLKGPAFLVERALPHLVTSGNAAILNVISPAAYLFAQNQAMYAAGKAGLMALTRATAATYATRGVRVNALAPGTIDTDMVRNNPPEAQQSMANAAAMKRMGSPDEMVGPALFLVSDAASFVTGQVVFADGGLTPH